MLEERWLFLGGSPPKLGPKVAICEFMVDRSIEGRPRSGLMAPNKWVNGSKR